MVLELAPLQSQLQGVKYGEEQLLKGESKPRMLSPYSTWTHEAILPEATVHLAGWSAQWVKVPTSSLCPRPFLLLLTGVNWHKMRKELEILLLISILQIIQITKKKKKTFQVASKSVWPSCLCRLNNPDGSWVTTAEKKWFHHRVSQSRKFRDNRFLYLARPHFFPS